GDAVDDRLVDAGVDVLVAPDDHRLLASQEDEASPRVGDGEVPGGELGEGGLPEGPGAEVGPAEEELAVRGDAGGDAGDGGAGEVAPEGAGGEGELLLEGGAGDGEHLGQPVDGADLGGGGDDSAEAVEEGVADGGAAEEDEAQGLGEAAPGGVRDREEALEVRRGAEDVGGPEARQVVEAAAGPGAPAGDDGAGAGEEGGENQVQVGGEGDVVRAQGEGGDEDVQ